MNAKVLSWAAKIISVAFMILSFFFTDKQASDICIVGLTIMAVVGTIDISIWIDKIVGKSVANNNTADAIGTEVQHDPDAGDDDPEFPTEMPLKTRKRVGFKK